MACFIGNRTRPATINSFGVTKCNPQRHANRRRFSPKGKSPEKNAHTLARSNSSGNRHSAGPSGRLSLQANSSGNGPPCTLRSALCPLVYGYALTLWGKLWSLCCAGSRTNLLGLLRILFLRAAPSLPFSQCGRFPHCAAMVS